MNQFMKLSAILGLLFLLLTGCQLDSANSHQEEQQLTTASLVTSENSIQKSESTERVVEQTEQQSVEDGIEQAWNVAKMRNYYAGIIRRAYYNVAGSYPTLEDMEQLDQDNMEDKFAICDIDFDGKEELIMSVMSVGGARMGESIHDYNVDTNEVVLQFSEYPLTTHFDNGMIKAQWSHNQGLGPDFSPYNLYSYDADGDVYEKIASIETWEKKYYPQNPWEGIAFPDELDIDGDGVLYCIQTAENEWSNEWCDKVAYDEWYTSCLGTAKEMELPWQSLYSEEWQGYVSDYVHMITERRKNDLVNGETDIGVSFLESEANSNVVEDELSQKFDFRIAQAEYSELVEYGYVDEQPVLTIYNEGSTSIEYADLAIDNLTIFGVYPGMLIEEAHLILEGYGFKNDGNNNFYSGEDHGSYAIYVTEEEGVVTKIMISQFSMFAG